MKLVVESYSGRKADERPIRFRLAGVEYLVEEVLDQWYGPSDSYFKVRADDDNLLSCGGKYPLPTDFGIWSRFDNSSLRHSGNLGHLLAPDFSPPAAETLSDRSRGSSNC